MPIYHGLWRPGTGKQFWLVTSSTQELEQENRKHVDAGLRLVILRRMDDLYTAVWRPGTGAQLFWSGTDFDHFRQQDTTNFNNGLRLVSMDAMDGYYTGVWRPGSGEQHVSVGLSIDEFTQKDTEFFAKGLRLVTMTWDHNPILSDQYMGLWRTGSGGLKWMSGENDTQFWHENTHNMNNGLVMSAFPPVLYTGIWKPGTGPVFVGPVENDTNTFVNMDDQQISQGMRLVDLWVGNP